MKIEKKYMSKPNWKRILQKEYVSKNIIEASKKCSISLLYILELTEPSYKIYNNKKIKIADKNYYWLQIALEDENYWITAMYDDKKKIIQYYIDITLKNVIKDSEDSYFLDLFLDIVKLSTGEIVLLDEDELKEALKEKNITEDEYNLAYKVAERVKTLLENDENYIENICKKYFDILMKDIKIK